MTLQTRINDIRARVEKATPGPWEFVAKLTRMGSSFVKGVNGGFVAMIYRGPNADNTAEFIAHSRTDIEYLLAIVEKQREALKFYAHQNHMITGFDDAECPSGEVGIVVTPEIIGEADGVTVEDGAIARACISECEELE